MLIYLGQSPKKQPLIVQTPIHYYRDVLGEGMSEDTFCIVTETNSNSFNFAEALDEKLSTEISKIYIMNRDLKEWPVIEYIKDTGKIATNNSMLR
eukprot:TRINITY_DN5950_c0_g1_i1.p1 TRINITY_DN5950_c0_g1~~TRINITY_DN5950_c0_g1_i1.p1  ORF type:complete len:95 (+),score=11.37 TRINITY_DN5950_c0_g1_i1:739-1023(+)